MKGLITNGHINVSYLVFLIICAAVLFAVIYFFRFVNKRARKKQSEQEEVINANKQQVNMLVIDKKKMHLKDSGLPDIVLQESKWYSNFFKVPIVKAKVGPKVQIFIADQRIFDLIPIKKEVKATISGLYITEVRGIRGALQKPEKKRGFIKKLFGEK